MLTLVLGNFISFSQHPQVLTVVVTQRLHCCADYHLTQLAFCCLLHLLFKIVKLTGKELILQFMDGKVVQGNRKRRMLSPNSDIPCLYLPAELPCRPRADSQKLSGPAQCGPGMRSMSSRMLPFGMVLQHPVSAFLI